MRTFGFRHGTEIGWEMEMSSESGAMPQVEVSCTVRCREKIFLKIEKGCSQILANGLKLIFWGGLPSFSSWVPPEMLL